MKRTLAIFALLAAMPASAQEIIDGSGQDIDPITKGGIVRLIANQMIDPASAQFRNLRPGVQGDYAKVWCGEVNAKNRLGGYTGFRPFNVTFKNGQMNSMIASDDPARFVIVRELQKGNGCG